MVDVVVRDAPGSESDNDALHRRSWPADIKLVPSMRQATPQEVYVEVAHVMEVAPSDVIDIRPTVNHREVELRMGRPDPIERLFSSTGRFDCPAPRCRAVRNACSARHTDAKIAVGERRRKRRGANGTRVPAPRAQREPWNNGLGGAGDASSTPSAVGLVKREDTLKSNLVRYSIGRQWFFAALALPALGLGCAAGGGGSSSAGDDPPASTGPLAPAPAAPVMRAPAVPNPMAAPPTNSSSATPASAANGASQNAGSETSPDPDLDGNAPAPAAGQPGAEPGSDVPPTPPADDAPAGGDEEEDEDEEEEEEDD